MRTGRVGGSGSCMFLRLWLWFFLSHCCAKPLAFPWHVPMVFFRRILIFSLLCLPLCITSLALLCLHIAYPCLFCRRHLFHEFTRCRRFLPLVHKEIWVSHQFEATIFLRISTHLCFPLFCQCSFVCQPLLMYV